MKRKKFKLPKFENVKIIDLAIDGKAVAKVKSNNAEKDEITVFLTKAVPGDIVDIQITKKKKKYYEGYPTKYVELSNERIDAFCEHFGICGGCTRQNLDYQTQLNYKQKQIDETLRRIGKIEFLQQTQIIPSAKIKYYRNKLEYTFSDKRWLTDDDLKSGGIIEEPRALGFHIPGKFDKVLDIKNCHLQAEPSNSIKNFIRNFSIKNNYTFYNLLEHKGFLRTLIIRTATGGETMVIVSFAENNKEQITNLLSALKNEFPQISSLMYVINTKKNDTILDLEIKCFSGKDHIIEHMDNLQFKVSPKSFYQTNSEQALVLYKKALEYADLKGHETVYDLYTGTGTIANFAARKVKKVIGIEYVPEAIEDAKINSEINNIKNTEFFAGDIKNILNKEFINENGNPDVIILDPPRAGIHPDVIQTIINTQTPKIVYISCNPATQARDINLLSEHYQTITYQPFDMFPHTHHTENVVLLKKKI